MTGVLQMKSAFARLGLRSKSVPSIPDQPAAQATGESTERELIPTLGPTMTAVTWHGLEKVVVEEQPRVMITDTADAIVKVTATTICGSDLHIYHGEFNRDALHSGYVLGHEAIGIVAEVGPDCKRIKPGDKVVIPFSISCGTCEYCVSRRPSLCDCTNPSKDMEKLYGHRTAGLFGYSDLLGGYDGLQASVARVPYADVNLLVIPQTAPYSSVDDGQLLLLSDVACTSFHATELGHVGQEGCKTVCIWGAGPIGLGAATWAKFRGATKVVVIDDVPYRLEMAKTHAGADETIDFAQCMQSGSTGMVKAVQRAFPNGGPDVCIDAAGFRYAKNPLHAAARVVGMETDSPTTINEMIVCCKKGGRIVLIADYFAISNGPFYVGALMEKGLTMVGGQAWPQRWAPAILDHMASGRINLKFLITHVGALDDAAAWYAEFDRKGNPQGRGILKVLLKPAA